MSDVHVAAYKTIGSVFGNEVGFEKLTYSFAADGGATTNVYQLAKVTDKILILNAVVQVETACTSSGSATVKIGPTTADDDAFLDVTSGAVASLTDDAVVREATCNVVIGADDYISLVVGTAALTAGKVNVFVQYVNAV